MPIQTSYLSQKQDSTCMAVAITNACHYLNITPPRWHQLTEDLHCNNGKAFGGAEVIHRTFEDQLQTTDEFDTFIETGGILVIMHPIFNLHATFCFPKNGEYTWINSWLGPNILTGIGKTEIRRFVPKPPNVEFWALSKG